MFKVGDRVCCFDAVMIDKTCIGHPVLGEKYTVQAVSETADGGAELIQINETTTWWLASRFVGIFDNPQPELITEDNYERAPWSCSLSKSGCNLR